MIWPYVLSTVVLLLSFKHAAGAQPLRVITPATLQATTAAATTLAAPALPTSAALDAALATSPLGPKPPQSPADPWDLPETINITDSLSPVYPMWPGAMQHLVHKAANASFHTQDAAGASAQGFVVRNGTQFYRHGKPFYFVGGNAYWLVDFYTMSWGRVKIDQFFDSCQALGLRVIRTWMFNIYLPKSRATYDSRELAGIDYIIWSAKQRGLMLVFTLGNSWNAYKAPEEFLEMATGTADKKDILDFYGDPATRALYKLHIWGLLTRVNPLTGLAPRDDPTIFSWNVLNEPRCPGCMKSSQQATHQDFLSDMAQFLRAVDPHHLISAATEGFFVEDPQTLLHFYNPGPGAQCDGEDWFKISTIPEIDYTTIHVYERHMELLPQPSGNPGWPNWIFCGWDCYVNWFKNYVGLHVFLSQDVLKKPLVVEEFGLTYHRMTLPQQRVLFKVLFDMQFQSAKSGGALAGTMFWNAARNDSIDSDGYNIQIDRPAYYQPASAIAPPVDLPTAVVTAVSAEEKTNNITSGDGLDVIFTSDGASPGLAAQMTKVNVPVATVKVAINTAAAAAAATAAAAAAAALLSNADTAALPHVAAVPTAAGTSAAAAAVAASSSFSAISSPLIRPGFTGQQEVVAAAATGRKLLNMNSNDVSNTIQGSSAVQQVQERDLKIASSASTPRPSSSSSSSSRSLLVVQDHLDAFRRGGWRDACAVEAAKTWRPYKLFNTSNAVQSSPMYDQWLSAGNVVQVITEATAKLHQLVAGEPLAG